MESLSTPPPPPVVDRETADKRIRDAYNAWNIDGHLTKMWYDAAGELTEEEEAKILQYEEEERVNPTFPSNENNLVVFKKWKRI